MFFAAAGIRLLALESFPGNYDTRSYEEVLAVLERGGDLYRDTVRYNYSPVWSFILRGAQALAAWIGSDLRFAVGLLLFAVDALTAVLLYRIAASRGDRRRALFPALLFFANPVSMLISSAHGQFDNISILFLLLAVFFAGGSSPRPSHTLASLSASLLVKHITWFHPLLFARRGSRQAFVVGLTPYVVFALSFLPYWRSWPGIRAHVISYRGLGGLYGVELLDRLPGAPFWLPDAVFGAAVILSLFLLRRVEVARASLLLFLVLLIFTPGIGVQYFVWPIALGALFSGPGYLLYTAVTAVFFLQAGPGGSDASFGPTWHGPWLAAVVWLLWEIRSLRRNREAQVRVSCLDRRGRD